MSSSTYNFSLPLESLGKTVLKLYSKVYKSEHTQIETENESLIANCVHSILYTPLFSVSEHYFPKLLLLFQKRLRVLFVYQLYSLQRRCIPPAEEEG